MTDDAIIAPRGISSTNRCVSAASKILENPVLQNFCSKPGITGTLNLV